MGQPVFPLDEPQPGEPQVHAGTPLAVALDHAERSDAARNRQLLLDAAEQLVREHGVDGVTMDEVARRAGVGKGTVFRRFGNRTGLMVALLDRSDRKFQQAFMFGPPPLGPGAEPVERLVAFGFGLIGGIDIEGELSRAAVGSSDDYYSSARYNLVKAHVSHLLRAAGTTGDIPLLADTLLASLGPALVLHQTRVLGYRVGQIGDHWAALVRRVVRSPGQ